MEDIQQWIGIDVCKRWLDVHVRPVDKIFRVSNDASGIQELLITFCLSLTLSVLARVSFTFIKL